MKVLNQVEFNPANQKAQPLQNISSSDSQTLKSNMFNNLNYYKFFH